MDSRLHQPQRLKLARVVTTVLVVGFVLTSVVGLIVGNRQIERNDNALAAEADRFAIDLEQSIDRSLDAYETQLSGFENQWSVPLVWQATFDAVRPNLPGDTASALLVAVPPERLDAFVLAEGAYTAGFALALLNSTPPETGHLLFMRTTQPDSDAIGLDLSTFGAVIADSLSPTEPKLGASDFRFAGAPDTEASLQVTIPTMMVGPDREIYQAWLIGQIDVPALIAQASSGLNGSIRAEVRVDIAGQSSNMATGVAPDSTFSSETARFFEVAGLDVRLRYLATDSISMGATREDTLVRGATLTALAAVLASILLLFRSLRDRADRSATQALSDDLTNLPNRRWLMRHLAERWHDNERVVAVFFCDMDRFKVVNDSLGHTAGDELLQAFAGRLQSILGPDQHVVRFGGDEFILCVEFCAQDFTDETTALSEQILAVAKQPFAVHDTDFSTTVSVGVAHRAPDADSSPEDLIREADTALFQAKKNGRNQVVVFDDVMRNESLGRISMERDLRDALRRGQLEIHYQPLMNASGTVVSFEALARWRRDDRLVPPDEFLPVVEELRLMGQLGSVVLHQAASQLRRWRDQIGPDAQLTMHVNVDPQEFRNRHYAEGVASALEQHNISPQWLVLEITEQALPDMDVQTTDVLLALQELGVGMAIDDFGTGHSSLSRLADVPGLTKVKIDRAISVRVQESPVVRAIINGVLGVARELGIDVTAEGVETAQEFEALISLGVDSFQGWHLGRPSPANDCAPWIASLRGTEPASPLASTAPDDTASLHQDNSIGR